MSDEEAPPSPRSPRTRPNDAHRATPAAPPPPPPHESRPRPGGRGAALADEAAAACAPPAPPLSVVVVVPVADAVAVVDRRSLLLAELGAAGAVDAAQRSAEAAARTAQRLLAAQAQSEKEQAYFDARSSSARSFWANILTFLAGFFLLCGCVALLLCMLVFR